jgi:alkylation response protein AidB-like acyl-CoA dehydrogenase
MQLEFSPAEIAFQKEVRTFIAENYPENLRSVQDEGHDLSKEDFLSWHRILAKKGWIVPAWPTEYGGTGWTATQRYHLVGRTAAADTVRLMPFGLSMVGPVIYTFGTPEQKAKFLPRILSGEDWWCQGYSEPGAGSDLASLRTRAERFTGDDGKEYYRVNGQKTWTTMAQHADWGFFLVRTDPTAKIQEGISFLLIDMKTPGITVRPIITLGGEHEVNEVWLEDVIVPVENRVFHENKGWTCAKFLLAHERTGIAGVAASKRNVERIKDVARKTEDGGDRADGQPVLQAQGGRTGSRSGGAGIYRTAHPRWRKQRQGPRAGIQPAEDQGHRNPAAAHRAGAGSRRHLWRAVLPLALAKATTASPSARTAPAAPRRCISTCARPASMAGPTRSSATSSPRWCWGAAFSEDHGGLGWRPSRKRVDHGRAWQGHRDRALSPDRRHRRRCFEGCGRCDRRRGDP